ncbi:MAG: hypothetical protein LUD15_12515 [Bacteroides sp.]|nr:hypothetical protein [Bacteroides sp.]
MIKLHYLAILFIWVACTPYSEEVKHTLEAARNNRAEMEEVLAYFKDQGRTPYRAACFIVANMPYHKSRTTIEVDVSYKAFFTGTDSLYSELFKGMELADIQPLQLWEYDSLRLELAAGFNGLSSPKPAFTDEWDMTTVSAAFLITTIEQALTVWKESPYLKDMPFDEFKEFVSPYRVTNEALMLDKSTIRSLYEERILKENSPPSITDPLERFKVYVDKCRLINKHTHPKEHAGIYDLFLPKFKMDCYNMTNWSCNILRACGIPVVYEFTPQWRKRTQRHFWCVSPDSTGIWQPYTAPDNNIREDWESDIKYAGKVYRKTFGAQRNTPWFMAAVHEAIPSLFDTPLLADQTWYYHQTVTLRLPFTERVENQVVYLCMDLQGELNPVSWGRVDSRKEQMIFEQVPLNTLFFPACYDEDRLIPVGEPFMIQADGTVPEIPLSLSGNKPGKVYDITVKDGVLYRTGKLSAPLRKLFYLTLSCDTTRTLSMHTERKYPEKRRLRDLQERLRGVLLLGSNEKLENFDTLCVLGHTPYPFLQQLSVEKPGKYRYYLFTTHDRGPVNIAHLKFLGARSGDHRCVTPTPLPIFSREEEKLQQDEGLCRILGTPLRTGSKSEVAFDGDYLTFAGSSRIGMDFGSPATITYWRFVPRTANNGIVRQNRYVLMYYDQGWKEAGVKYASANFLDWEDVPQATLFRLRNLTEGKEELPFFYLERKQYFLHTDTLKRELFIAGKSL